MSGDRFARALAAVLKHEGGYVNHPKDPGGATNKGVTQRTYDDWRRRQGQSRRSVRSITAEEIAAIYRRDYWDAVKADQLPAGIAYAVFDFAVNSGPVRAIRFLQRAAGVADDGLIGPRTIAAVRAASQPALVRALCADRAAWLRKLSEFPTFGRGWLRRVREVEAAALKL